MLVLDFSPSRYNCVSLQLIRVHFVAVASGGDGGEVVEGRLHGKRWGVPQLHHTREPRLPGCHQKGVSESLIALLIGIGHFTSTWSVEISELFIACRLARNNLNLFCSHFEAVNDRGKCQNGQILQHFLFSSWSKGNNKAVNFKYTLLIYLNWC